MARSHPVRQNTKYRTAREAREAIAAVTAIVTATVTATVTTIVTDRAWLSVRLRHKGAYLSLSLSHTHGMMTEGFLI